MQLFYGPLNKQKKRALDTRNNSLQELAIVPLQNLRTSSLFTTVKEFMRRLFLNVSNQHIFEMFICNI